MAGQADDGRQGIARAFVEARRAGRALPEFPGAVPADLPAAYAIQDAAIALDGGGIAGWKVGRIHPPMSDRYGADRLAGPIFAPLVFDAAPVPVMSVFAGGFGAVEAEFLLRLARVDPERRSYGLSDALDMVTAVHVGLEIASSPFPGINDGGPAVTVSDFGNNHGLVVGAAIPDWRDRGLDDWTVATDIDGTTVGTGRAAAFPDGLAGAARFLLQALAARGIAVAEGCWISSGAVTGVHPIAPGQHAVARFGDDFEIRCEIAAAEPR